MWHEIDIHYTNILMRLVHAVHCRPLMKMGQNGKKSVLGTNHACPLWKDVKDVVTSEQ